MEHGRAVKSGEVLKNKNYLLLFTGALTSNVGTTLYSFAASFYILDLSANSALLQGTYLAFCGCVFVLCSVAAGAFVNRFDKVRIIWGCDFVKGGCILLSALLYALATRQGAPALQMAVLFFVGFVNNAVAAVFSPTSRVLIPHLVEDRVLQQANAYFSVMNSVQDIVGVALAGVLYSLLPAPALFALVGACYIASGISELFIKSPEIKAQGAPFNLRSIFGNFREGLSYILHARGLRALIFGAMISNFFLTPYLSNGLPFFGRTALTGAYFLDSLLTPEMWVSAAGVAASLGSFVFGLVLSTRSTPQKCGGLIARRLFLQALTVCLLPAAYCATAGGALFPNLYLLLLLPCWFAVGGTVVSINVPFITTVQRGVPAEKRPQVFSLMGILSTGMMPLASFIGGIVLDRAGFGALGVCCAAGLLLNSVCLLLSRAARAV